MTSILKSIGKFISILIIFFIFLLVIINLLIYIETKNSIIQLNGLENQHVAKREFAIVLGASVHGKVLSGALRERVQAAIQLYKMGLVNKILMSGDGTGNQYNETSAMKFYAIKKGIPSNIIYTDERGYNTYLSIQRAKKIFSVPNAFIISQNFHIARAVWLGRNMHFDCMGIGVGQIKFVDYNTYREILARVKDFFIFLLE